MRAGRRGWSKRWPPTTPRWKNTRGERTPLDWAAAQNNLGIVLWSLGERENGTARLEQAVAAYHAALEEYTRERTPLDWAMTEGNLGSALAALGERESGTGWRRRWPPTTPRWRSSHASAYLFDGRQR